MSREVTHSPIFGPYRPATDREDVRIRALVNICPVHVFAALNRRLNAKGLCITIDRLDKTPLTKRDLK